MAFDIYGSHLRPGCCEVHPDHQGSYPCDLCMDDYYSYQEEQYYSDQYYEEQADLCHIIQHAEAVKELSDGGVEIRPIWVVGETRWIRDFRPKSLPKKPGYDDSLPSQPRAGS